MYPPINSWTTLQSADKQLKITFLSSSNWIIICFVSQLTFHAWKIKTKNWTYESAYDRYIIYKRHLLHIYFIFILPSWYWISMFLCDPQYWELSAWSCLMPPQGAPPAFHRETEPRKGTCHSQAMIAKLSGNSFLLREGSSPLRLCAPLRFSAEAK